MDAIGKGKNTPFHISNPGFVSKHFVAVSIFRSNLLKGEPKMSKASFGNFFSWQRISEVPKSIFLGPKIYQACMDQLAK